MSKLAQAYVGLGGNLGDSRVLLRQARMAIRAIPEVHHFHCSKIYQTTPVGPPQPNYHNAVCTFKTSLSPIELLKALMRIERLLGKVPKPKDAPRTIDLDILFYGSCRIRQEGLEIPHPRWKERLFVLEPLMDLVDWIEAPEQNGSIKRWNLHDLHRHFENENNEIVTAVGE